MRQIFPLKIPRHSGMVVPIGRSGLACYCLPFRCPLFSSKSVDRLASIIVAPSVIMDLRTLIPVQCIGFAVVDVNVAFLHVLF